MSRFSKESENIIVKVSEGWPRFTTIKVKGRDDNEVFGLEIEDIRDLKYMLERVISWVEQQDGKKV